MPVQDASVELITVDERLEAQETDEESQRIMKLIEGPKDSDYEVDERGLIVRIASSILYYAQNDVLAAHDHRYSRMLSTL